MYSEHLYILFFFNCLLCFGEQALAFDLRVGIRARCGKRSCCAVSQPLAFPMARKLATDRAGSGPPQHCVCEDHRPDIGPRLPMDWASVVKIMIMPE